MIGTVVIVASFIYYHPQNEFARKMLEFIDSNLSVFNLSFSNLLERRRTVRKARQKFSNAYPSKIKLSVANTVAHNSILLYFISFSKGQ